MNEIIARLEMLAHELLNLAPVYPTKTEHGRLGKGYHCLNEASFHLGQTLARLKDAKEWFNIEEKDDESDTD